MKSIVWLIWLFVIHGSLLHAQTLFTYGGRPVSKEEFRKAFLKNNTKKEFTEQDYRDYLELYIRFKLKVQAALDRKLDTLSSQKAETNEFRSQVIEEFLNDPASFNKLVKEAFERSRKDIHVAHIYMPLKIVAGYGTVSGKKYIDEAYRDLTLHGKLKESLSDRSPDTTVKVNEQDMGWLTVFTLPYEFENIVYGLSPGKFSKPYESKIGYHIFRNLGERKATGKIKAAQILLAFPPDPAEAVQNRIRQKADSIYSALAKGASFTELVAKYSDDRTTKPANGELPEFGPGQYDQHFDSAVFALQKPGTYTRPIRTSFGYHIVRLLDRIPVNTDSSNPEAMAALKQQVQADPRMEVARQAARAGMFTKTGFRKTAIDPDLLSRYTDSALRGASSSAITGQTVLFSFEKEKVNAADWIKYLQAIGGMQARNAGKTWEDLLKQFADFRLEQYYRTHLEEYNSAFAAQMKEVREGNLYFEVMQQNVWQKAATDTVGLLNYYNQHKTNYWWEPSADALLFTCGDSATAYVLRSKLEKDVKDWRRVVQQYGDAVQSDSERFELTQLPVAQPASLRVNQLTVPRKGSAENPSYSFAYITHIYSVRSPRNFNDSKGFVLNDYQSELEDKWIVSLKGRYPVKVDETVLRSLWK